MKKLVIILGLFLILTSCASFNRTLLDLDTDFTEDVITSVENLKLISDNGIRKWQSTSGFIAGFLQDDFTNLPYALIEDWGKMDFLANAAKERELTDYEKGEALRLWLAITSDVIVELIADRVPEVVPYLLMLRP